MTVQALFFDVFGTLMDWRTSIARESKAILEPRGHSLDWLGFADAWRGEYQPAMEEVRAGKIPFSKLDVLHRRNLDRILPRFAIKALPEETLRDFNLAWHRLEAWPDVPPGLARLKKRYKLAPVSNGNISLMVDLARRNTLPWDAILGAEIAGDYKMVAAHSNDLKHAAACGLRTAHIARPNEHGPGKGEREPTVPVDFAARDLGHLADQLGV